MVSKGNVPDREGFKVDEMRLIGLEARAPDGTEAGRITETITDEENGEVTHAVIEWGEENFEVPIESLSLDPEADFATFHADASDEEPGDHTGDDVEPAGEAPMASDAEDYPHEGQLVAEPESEEEAQSEEDLVREDWQDEEFTPADSGYPRTDAYIDPDTGEESVDPAMNEGDSLADEAAKVLDATALEVRAVKDGVVELTGAATRDDLDESVEELMGLDGAREVDATDVDVG